MEKNKYAAQDRYHEKIGRIQFKMDLSPKTEQDIIDQLKCQGKGKQATYIKRLIREDIARNKKGQQKKGD